MTTCARTVFARAAIVAMFVWLPARADVPIDAKVKVFFGEDCETCCLRSIGKAKKEILVAAFSFTRKSIAKALIEQAEKGVIVKVKIDAEQADSKYVRPVIRMLKAADIDVDTVSMPPRKYMHNKFMVIDRRYVISGSYNFTTAATEVNWENLIWIESIKVADKYRTEWLRIKDKKKKKKKRKKR